LFTENAHSHVIATVLCTSRPEVQREFTAHLTQFPEIRLVADASNVEQMLKLMEQQQPDVLLLDPELVGASGLSVIPRLLSISPRTRILTLHSSCGDKYAGIAIEYGAAGCLPHTAPEVRRAVSAVCEGELWAERRLIAHLLRRLIAELHAHDEHGGPPLGPLTSREREIVMLMRQGLSNKEIAHALDISHATVKTHAHHILGKLHLSRRMELLMEPSAATPDGDDAFGPNLVTP
jgi:two-component system nitrate/nitrite response regulator NarL